MSKTRLSESSQDSSPLTVRLDEKSKRAVERAAELRGISISDYVRTVMVAQAQREVAAADQQTIELTPDEQITFWEALQAPAKLTPAQKKMAALMRGEL